MSVIDDILGIKKESPASTPVVNDQATPIVEEKPIQQSTTPVDFRSVYNNNGDFYDALSKTFGPREVIDEKAVKSRKNLAGLADFATNLSDIISGSIGGNVVARNSSASSDFDNKLMGYRRQLDDKNRQYDMMAYRAKMMDIQERMRRGERLEDIAHRDKREGIQDVRYKEEKDWRKERAGKQDEQWDKSFGMQRDQLDHRKKIDHESLELQKQRIEASERAAVTRYLYQNTKSKGKGDNAPVDFITNAETYSLPKKSAKAIVPQLYSIMQEDASKLGADETNLIDIKMTFGEGGDQASKMEAVVRANLNRYPRAEKFLKEYSSQSAPFSPGGSKWDSKAIPDSVSNKWDSKIIK